MKDWRRSPEPPGMMGLKDTSYQIQGNWGQPEELLHPSASSDFDPASPLPHMAPTVLLTDSPRTRNPAPSLLTGSNMSLYSMCLRVILRNVSSVQDLGDMPYRNAKPILEECRIDQLIGIEEASPHLLEHTEEIWKRNCLRDFIDLRKKYNPSNSISTTSPPKEPKSWRRLYFRSKGEIEQAVVEAAQRIKDKYAQHRAEKDAKKLVVSDRPLMRKSARSGGRKFGMMIGGGIAGGGASVSKGQSLINRAKAGSVAQAKLTARARGVFRTQGRSKQVGMGIAPEAAGVRLGAKTMIAPKRIADGASQGLMKMRDFSKPLPRSDSSDDAAKSTSRGSTASSQRTESEAARHGRPSADAADELIGLPRLKPHQLAAAPPLTPCTSSTASKNKSSCASYTGEKKSPLSSPPPDIARMERRKLDFFGSVRFSCSAAATGSSSGAGSPIYSITSGSEVRGMKRSLSASNTGKSIDSASIGNPSRTNMDKSSTLVTKNDTSPPARSATAMSFFQTTSNKSSSGVRVVQAKRARVQDTQLSPRNSPPSTAPNEKTWQEKSRTIPSSTNANTQWIASQSNGSSPRQSPAKATPFKQQSIALNGWTRSEVKDERVARASAAALSSIFAPIRSSPAGHGTRGANGHR